jgi:CMP-N-acetylneuraminic acid synthetase
MNKKVVGVVHAKSSSKRVKYKNRRKICGKPLFSYAVENSLAAEEVDLTVIDSDSDEILQTGQNLGATPLRRPDELANNKTTGDDLAYWQASNFVNSGLLVQVVPTSPFLKPRTIDRAVQQIRSKGVNSATTVVSESLYVWEDGEPQYYDKDGKIPNSYNMEKTTYETTGLYAAKCSYIMDKKKRLDPNSCALVEVDKIESLDINNEKDLENARTVMKGIKSKKSKYGYKNA